MQRMKKVTTGLAVAMLLAWLPSVTAFARPEFAAAKTSRAAIVERISARLTRPVVFRPQQKPIPVVKRVWIGGPPSLGGYEATVEQRSEQRPVQMGQVQMGRGQTQIQPRRVWVGGAPWLGGYEAWVTPK